MDDRIDELLEGFYNFKTSLEERTGGIEDRRFYALEKRVNDLEATMNTCFDQIEVRLDKIEKEVEELNKRHGTVRRIAGENMREIEILKEKVS